MKKIIGLNRKEAEHFGFKWKEGYIWQGNQQRFSVSDEQEYQLKLFRFLPNKRKFVNTQNKLDKNGAVVSSVEKLQSEPIDVPENFEVVKISTSKTTGQQWVQYKAKEVEVKDFDFKALIEKYTKDIKQIKVNAVATIKTNDFDTLTYTDVHIGMDTDKDKNSMYPILWNRKEVLKQGQAMIDKTLKNRTSDLLIVDDLGDLLDGYNEQTTRGGHKLPQNMSNEEAFDCALEFKMLLLKGLVGHYKKIVFNNICNDNHAGAFGYFVNSAFKEIAERMYKDVQVINHRQFINHYFIKKVCFVISHGKDDKALKFGFKPHLDTKSIEKIDQYCKHNNIYKKADLVIFKKGDSHQALFDMCGSDDFYYYNYPALSPSSNWVQSNFKKGRKGFVIEHFNKNDSTLKTFFQ